MADENDVIGSASEFIKGGYFSKLGTFPKHYLLARTVRVAVKMKPNCVM